MRVTKRNGSSEKVMFDKITLRIELLCNGLNPSLDPVKVAKETISNIIDDISTSELDLIAANVAESYKTSHSDYTRLAGRILMSNLIKSTPDTFAECISDIYNSSISGNTITPVVSELCDEFGIEPPAHDKISNIDERYVKFAKDHNDVINDIINSSSIEIEYIGMKTLLYNYLLKIDGVVHDRPQYMFMRVAIALYIDSSLDTNIVFENIRKCYQALNGMYIMHATPTLYNSCSPRQQLLSCFLLGVDDNIIDIMKTCANASLISKWAGGIGIHMHQIRSLGQKIHGTGGHSNGLIPQLRIWNAIALAWNQGGRRKGAIAIYLEPWHGDVMEFLELKVLNGGAESQKARDLFYAMWIPDLFMKRLIAGKEWSLFSNDEGKILSKLYDGMYIDGVQRDAFTEAYERFEAAGLAVSTVSASTIADKIFAAQRESGTPYICFKDHVNRKSAHMNIGIISSSNLCVHGDTLVLTDNGQLPIKSIVGKVVSVWNGIEYSKVVPIKTGEDMPLLKVRFSNNSEIKCTRYHKFYDVNENQITAEELQPGTVLAKFELPQDTFGVQPYDNLTVTMIADEGETGDVYCFSEPKRHRGMFNGILAGQCTEIMQYSAPDSYGCCTLSSINLPKYYDKATGEFSYEKLHEMARQCVRNLNRVIDINVYPVEECKVNNMQLRTLGIGVQGLADLFCLMRIPFDSEDAERVDLKIVETIYHGALTESIALAKEYGPYDAFKGSPASYGKLQFDLWYENTQVEKLCNSLSDILSGAYDWDAVRKDIQEHGSRNSLHIAFMPTVSTSQITGNNESFEPFTSNIYVKNTLGGRLTMVNKYMIEHLTELGLWNERIKNEVLAADGSIKNIDSIPVDVREVYKTVWEISQRSLIRRAALRGAFIDQAQSLNIYTRDNSDTVLRSIMIYGWKCGLKTGSYYIHSKSAVSAQKTVTMMIKPVQEIEEACPIGCTSCSS